jgi:hypothetical protein
MLFVKTMSSQNITINIDNNKIISPSFGGVGFHSFHHVHEIDDKLWNEVVYKRWRELAPTFVRLNHSSYWNAEQTERVVKNLEEYKKTNTEIYFTTWLSENPKTLDTIQMYTSKVANQLKYFKQDKGFFNIKYYCMSNELTGDPLDGKERKYGRWGALIDNMPRFKAFHQSFYDEFAKRNLNIGLLASDASFVNRNYWETIDWCAQNMDSVTAVYGGHHYINHTLTDKSFHNWFYTNLKAKVDIARTKGKNFIIGEFGPKQNNTIKNLKGGNIDKCEYYDTPQEALSGIQTATAIIASINAGVYATGYWTFLDFPNANPVGGYENKWGISRWNGTDFGTRDSYYAIGLLCRYFGGSGKIPQTSSSDSLVHVMAVHHENGKWSIAIVNENEKSVNCSLKIPTNGSFRKYVYDPANVSQNKFGDLQPPTAVMKVSDGVLKDSILGMSLVVYTTDFDLSMPAPVKNIKTLHSKNLNTVTWDANSESDICYYRVYRSTQKSFIPSISNQVASTISTNYSDIIPSDRNFYYKVIAVDRFGNSGNKQ